MTYTRTSDGITVKPREKKIHLGIPTDDIDDMATACGFCYCMDRVADWEQTKDIEKVICERCLAAWRKRIMELGKIFMPVGFNI